MAYDEKTKSLPKAHSVMLDNRCRLSATGVEDVESFDETAIVMNTTQGNLIIRGSGLHIGKINLDAGELTVEGMISDLNYEEKSEATSFWSKLFV